MYISIRLISIISFIVYSCYSQGYNPQKCRVLVLPGGGSKGSYQAGAIRSLVDHLSKEEVQWNSVSGTSVGAINAVGVSMYELGDERNMSRGLLDLWRRISTDKVYKYWPFGIVDGILFKQGIFDSQPLRNFLKESIVSPLKRMTSITATEANKGTRVVFNETLQSLNDIVQSLMCSSAIPVIFPHQQFQNTTLIDGGVIINMNIQSGIQRCQDIGYQDQDIIVDIISLDVPINIDEIDLTSAKTLDMIARLQQINSYFRDADELIYAKQDYPLVQFRYFIKPTSTLLPFGLNFDPAVMEELINRGYDDAKITIQKGEGVSFDEFYQDILKTKKIFYSYKN